MRRNRPGSRFFLITAKVLLVMALALAAGCRIGHSSLVFATRTNTGLDLDTTPPVFEVSIAREEGVIEPQFEDGKTLPVMASFRSRSSGPMRLYSGVASSFATGKAAAGMAQHFGADDQTATTYDGLVLKKKPKRVGFWSWIPFVHYTVDAEFPEPGTVRPLFFGTQSMFGAKIEWNGTTAQYPSGAKIGYNRSELALVPVTLREETVNSKTTYHVDTSSLLGTVDGSLDASDPANAGLTYMQYFATGDAAEKLVLRKQVRQVMIKELVDPKVEVKNDLQTNLEANKGLVLRVANLIDKLTFADGREREDMYKLQTAYDVGLAMGFFLPPQALGANAVLTEQAKPTVKGCYEGIVDSPPTSTEDTQVLNAIIGILD